MKEKRTTMGKEAKCYEEQRQALGQAERERKRERRRNSTAEQEGQREIDEMVLKNKA